MWTICIFVFGLWPYVIFKAQSCNIDSLENICICVFITLPFHIVCINYYTICYSFVFYVRTYKHTGEYSRGGRVLFSSCRASPIRASRYCSILFILPLRPLPPIWYIRGWMEGWWVIFPTLSLYAFSYPLTSGQI